MVDQYSFLQCSLTVKYYLSDYKELKEKYEASNDGSSKGVKAETDSATGNREIADLNEKLSVAIEEKKAKVLEIQVEQCYNIFHNVKHTG